MFGAIRDKFQSIQEGLSASIRGITLADTGSKSKKINNQRTVNYDAGAEVLHHFQMEWNNLHELLEENAQKAQGVEVLINTVKRKLESQYYNIALIDETIPKLNSNIQALMDQIGSLQDVFEEIENEIFKANDLQEVLELQSSQLDHRFQLALYQEKTLSELENIREKLATEHADKVQKYERQQEKFLKERQETFEEAFKEELDQYKKTGSVPKTSKSLQKGPSLEDIIIEADSTDYDQFLDDQ